jgi:hypothetical protein
MVHWNTGESNAHLRVLKLRHDHFAGGEKMVEASSGSPQVLAQGFIDKSGLKSDDVTLNGFAVAVLTLRE